MRTTLIGAMMIGVGLLYLLKPGVYRRGIWMKTSLAIRLLSEENYRRYMRGLGVTSMAIGIALVLWVLFRHLGWLH
jgi:hypothetical protein